MARARHRRRGRARLQFLPRAGAPSHPAALRQTHRDIERRRRAPLEITTMTWLEQLLAKYPDTPKKRAKQWIVAGRVKANGVVVRQPQAEVTGEVELLDRRQVSLPVPLVIHPRVTLLHLDTALAVVNK